MKAMFTKFLVLAALSLSLSLPSQAEESLQTKARNLKTDIKHDAKGIKGKVKAGTRKTKGAAKEAGRQLKAAAKKIKHKIVD